MQGASFSRNSSVLLFSGIIFKSFRVQFYRHIDFILKSSPIVNAL
jgi:hypothetical protein